MALQPDLPEQVAPSAEQEPVSEERLRAWLDNIHISPDGTRTLLKRVAQLNRRLLHPSERERLLTLLATSVRAHLDVCQAYVRAHRFPMPARSRKIFSLGQSLRREMGLGYMLVTVDAQVEDAHSPQIARGAVQALCIAGEYLLRSTQVYTPVPTRFWHNVHALYALTEATGVEKERSDRTSPVNAYKRILLFACGHAHGLPRADTDRVYEALAAWATLARLTREREKAREKSFAVDLDHPEPPRQTRLLPADSVGDHRFLDVTGVITAGERALRVRGGGPLGRISPMGLERLLVNWRQDTLRRSPRQARDQRVDVEVTLHAIQTRLAAATAVVEASGERADGEDEGKGEQEAQLAQLKMVGDEDEFRDPYADFVSHPGRSIQVRRDDIWSRGVDRKSDAYFRERRAVEAAGLQSAVRNPEQAWQLVDISANGFGLEWVGRGNSNVTVGELVSMAVRRKDGVHWRLGVIRWLRFTGPDRFLIGARVLADDALPARLSRPARPGAQGPAEPGLILGEGAQGGQAERIIVPTQMFELAEPLQMECGEGTFRIKLEEVIEETGSFSLCRFSLLTEDDRDNVPQWELI